MKYYLVPANNGEVPIPCPTLILGLPSGDGTKRIVRCASALENQPGVVELTPEEAREKTQQYSDELEDVYTGVGQ